MYEADRFFAGPVEVRLDRESEKGVAIALDDKGEVISKVRLHDWNGDVSARTKTLLVSAYDFSLLERRVKNRGSLKSAIDRAAGLKPVTW